MESTGTKAPDSTPAVQVQATEDLVADLRKMINNPDFSDIVIVCEERKRLHANRMLLMARSSVLKSLLKKNKKAEISLPENKEAEISLPENKEAEISLPEKKEAEISLPENKEAEMSLPENKEAEISLPENREAEIFNLDFSSSALLSIFEFLYTGTMVVHAPMNSVKAYEVLSASRRYFQLRKMEEMVREFLVNSIAEVTDDISKAAIGLSVALEFRTVYDTTDAILTSLVRILKSKDLEPIHLRGLSKKAFQYFLKETQSTTGPATLSFGEYLRFRQIILWCTTQVCPDEAAEVVKSSLPDARSAWNIWRDAPKIVPARRPAESYPNAGDLKSLLLERPNSAALVDRLLKLVDFRRVHAELLDVVVEPLNIVSASELKAAYQFQALHKSTGMPKAPQYKWEYGSSYAVVGDRYSNSIAKTNPEVGFARLSVPIGRPYGVYEWDIIVEQLCAEFCELGFHYEDGLHHEKPRFTGTTLAQQPTGWALSNHKTLGTRINQPEGGGKSNDGWVDFNKDFAHENARVRVHLDMFERSCSFSVDKDQYWVAWSNLPDGVYYPAVSLGSGRIGRVRIELVNGFDMLYM